MGYSTVGSVEVFSYGWEPSKRYKALACLFILQCNVELLIKDYIVCNFPHNKICSSYFDRNSIMICWNNKIKPFKTHVLMCCGQSLCEMLVQYSPHTPWGCQTGPGRMGTTDHIFAPDPSLVLPSPSGQSCDKLLPRSACARQLRHIGTERSRPPEEKPSFCFPCVRS